MNSGDSLRDDASEGTREPRLSGRFRSLAELTRKASSAARRFPLVLASATAAAAVAHLFFESDFNRRAGHEALLPVLLTCMLGIPLFFALRLTGESRGWTGRRRTFSVLAGVAALVLYYMLLPFPPRNADGYRFILLLAALHLWVSFAPFTAPGAGENGFWQYNRLLFQRFVIAVLYSGVLFIGLSLALGACDALLGLDVDEETYLQLFLWISFLYNTWFFLGGVPSDLGRLRDLQEYPTGMRIFTEYVLIPLVVVYLVILYAYLVKIILQWELPKGWVGYPIIGVAVTGMLALLLVHPLRESEEHGWIARYSRYFHWTLFPLIALLGVSIWTRIEQYGVTEKRYLLVAGGIWLLAIAVLFSLKRSVSIRIIPVSLCLVTIVSAVGPVSATVVSRRNQLDRLRDLLVAAAILDDGRIRESHPDVGLEREREISAILTYLYDLHGLEMIRDWYAGEERMPDPLTPRVAAESMGVEYRARWERTDWLSVSLPAPNPIPLANFDYLFEIEGGRSGPAREGRASEHGFTLRLAGTRLDLLDAADPEGVLGLDLAPALETLRQEGAAGWREEPLAVSGENDRYRVTAYITGVRADLEDSIDVRRLTAQVLVGMK